MRKAAGLLAISTLCLTPLAAQAQQPPATDLQRQVEDTFRQVLVAPGDLNLGYRYAKLLVEAGNFEGGIAALERLLVDPNASPTIRLELAVLYYRLGSYAAAEAYARQAAADPRLDGGLRAQAEKLAADSARRGQPQQLSGSVTMGLRVQSNPTGASNNSLIRSNDIMVQRPAGTKAKSDADFQLSGQLEHAYDLGTQNSAAIASTVSGFANHYWDAAGYNNTRVKTDPQDLIYGEGTSGIRFKPAPTDAAGFTVRPHAIMGDALLDAHQYFFTYGVGSDFDYRPESGKWQVGATYQLRKYDFASRRDVANASGQDGVENALRLRGSLELAPGHILAADLGLRDRDADFNYFAYKGADFRLAYIASYADPLTKSGRPWTSSVYAGPTFRRYEAPDPAVSRSIKRRDTEYRVGATNLVPISDSWSILTQLEYTRGDSNLPNYDYDNVMGLAGLSWRF